MENQPNFNKLPSPNSNINYESIPDFSGNREVAGANNNEVFINSYETANTAERVSSASREAKERTDINTPQLPQVAIDPQSSNAQPIEPPRVATNPTIASDEDQIEQEWINKAKEVIARTQGDPARRKDEVTALQRDYQFKRYGRELGKM